MFAFVVLHLFVFSTKPRDWLTKKVSEVTYFVSDGT